MTATLAIVTFLALVLELTSTRLFAYIGSSHATSTALSIALLGLGLGAAARLRFPARAGLAAPGLAAALLGFAAAAIAGMSLPVLVATSVLPFACAGARISEAYAARGSARARGSYAIDLAAAALACLVAPRFLGPLSPIEIVLLLGLAASALAIRYRLAAVTLAAAHLALLIAGRAGALPDGPLEALFAADRAEKAIVEASSSPGDVLDSAWSPLGRLDVRRVPDEAGQRLGVFTDGMSPTYLVEKERAKAGAFEPSWGLLMALPYRALRPRHVLILGAGAGASVWLAKKYGAARVDAVEVNPAIRAVLARWRGFAGEVYHQAGVRLVIADARRYLADTTARYDLIELALALTGNAQAQAAGLEAHLYTVEAVQLYLDRLTPTGALVLIHSDPGNAYRQLLTVLEALDARGVPRDRALEQLVVLRDPRPGTAYQYLLVVRAAAMPLDVADRLDVPPAESLWAPGDAPERGTQLLDPAQLGATSADDLAPVHDDRPYFFQNARGLVATALAEPGRLVVLGGALLLVVVLIATPRDRGFARPAIAAACCSAAFLTVELALIQRLTLAAGGTLYAISFVLFALLAWSAAGALLARRLAWSAARAAVIAAVAIATALIGAPAWLDAIASDAARLLLIAALLAPVGLALGGPFPTLLAHHGEPPERLASLWAIGGVASVAGGVVAVLALRVGGATVTLGLAAVLYLAAALAGRR